MNAYVIKSWKASETPDADGNYVHIVGRTGGLISWILNLVGISPTVELSVTSDLISFKQGSWGGTVQYLTPLENTCATFYGYTKPWLLSLIIGLATFFLLGIPGIIYYFLNKVTTVGFTDMGGRASHIDFKRSVIESQKLDEDSAFEVCRLIQNLVEGRTGARLSGSVPPRKTKSAPQRVAVPVKQPAAKKYYYADAQAQPQGPFTFRELATLAASGEVKPDTYVVTEGASEWSRWDTIKDTEQP